MSNFRGRKALKIEFIAATIILISVGLFAVERRDLFVETVLEQNYDDLSVYKNACDALRSTSCSAATLRSILTTLQTLDRPGFVLQDDVKLTRAQVRARLGEYSAAQDILNSVISGNSDGFSKADAVFQLASILDKRGQTTAAVRTLENNFNLFDEYRRAEAACELMTLLSGQDKLAEAGKYLMAADSIDPDSRGVYVRVAKADWQTFSREDKEKILSQLIKMKRYEDYAGLAVKFVKEYRPEPYRVEQISLDLVYRSQSSYVMSYINALSFDSNYQTVEREMRALYTLSGNTIDCGSASVRGVYYYRKLSALNHMGSYNSAAALSYFNDYLSGDVEQEYLSKNLTLTIRNLVAFKKYTDITNVVESAYVKMNLDPRIGTIDKNVSFWNGYADFQLGNYDRAFEEFENCIALHPEGYYAANSRDFILKILEIRRKTLNGYLSDLDYDYISNPETFTRLRDARLLFAFRDGYARALMRDKVVEIMQQFNGDYFFEFDDNEIRRLRSSTGYVKFVIYTRYGFVEKAKLILASLGIDDPRKQEALILAQLVQNREFVRAHDTMIRAGNDRFVNDNFAFFSRDIQETFYPRPYDTEIQVALAKLNNRNVDEFLVYAIIRQESMFVQKARSHAGARGLMQLMPSTASLLARSIWGTSEVDSYNTVNNIMMGTRYISENVQAYGLVPAIAAYNGGYSIVKRVRNTYHPANDYELVEIIPLNETREYVKRVLTNYYRYRELYGNINPAEYSPAADMRLALAR